MSEAFDNLVLHPLQAIRADVAAAKREFQADLIEIKEQLGVIEQQYASLSRRMDRIAGHIERIEMRLSLVDETIG